jgi:hypothetical protein
MESNKLAVLVAAGFGLGVLLTPQAARADRGEKKQFRFVGGHPVAKSHGKGFCHVEAPHVHGYDAPSAKLQFRDHDGHQFFIGDPVAHGWDGPTFNYVGHHPIAIDVVVGATSQSTPSHQEFCFLDGPHFHGFAPAPVLTADFQVDAGAYFYIGTPPPSYVETRPALIKINAEYQRLVYQRPVVTVTPPAAWIGIRFAAPGVMVAPATVQGKVHGGKVHGGVGVDIYVPVPSVRVDIKLPSVNISGGAGVIFGGGVESNHGGKHKGKRGKGHRKHGD